MSLILDSMDIENPIKIVVQGVDTLLFRLKPMLDTSQIIGSPIVFVDQDIVTED